MDPRDSGEYSPDGPGAILQLIRLGEAASRADLIRITGLARSTVASRVDALIGQGFVTEVRGTASTGGRPPTVLTFNDQSGVVLVADLGATHARVAVSDLAARPLIEREERLDIAEGPEPVLTWLDAHFSALLAELGKDARAVRGLGIGVPGPVAVETGQPVNPPIMPGWNGFFIPEWFASRYDAPVRVDNDVNIMAIGEHRTHWRETQHLLFVKVATGIGCGIVAGGSIHRGAQGAAGDIGHVRLAGYDDVLCRCGNTGCLEAVAGGRAIAERLPGEAVTDALGVVARVEAGDAEAIRLVREAGRCLGEVLAGCVNFFNPGVIVLGGELAAAHEPLLAGVREVTIQRSLPLATRELRTVHSRLGDAAGVIGAGVMIVDAIFAPTAVDRAVSARLAA